MDGPLQIEARIDQNAQLSGQLSLWNQQGSHVRRGSLIVIPVGRALLYAEPIYLQAERSPMPELRLVVLALQDRLAYGPTFEAAMAGSSAAPRPRCGGNGRPEGAPPAAPPLRAGRARRRPHRRQTLISEAARDLADYQRLTAEGKLGEAGQKLEAFKQKLDELQRQVDGHSEHPQQERLRYYRIPLCSCFDRRRCVLYGLAALMMTLPLNDCGEFDTCSARRGKSAG